MKTIRKTAVRTGVVGVVAAFVFLALLCQSPKAYAGWSQVWVDDFNSFDTSKWNKGFAWGNAFGATPNTYYDPGNVWVSNGTLKLQAKNPGSNGYTWSGSMINTYNKAYYNPYWGYGYRIRALMKIPKGQGLNPSFWMAKNDSSFAWPPEIDIMEAPGGKNGSVHWTVHYASNGSGGSQSVGKSQNLGTVGDGKFHWYEVVWWREGYEFFVDNTSYFSNWDSNKRINASMYLMMGVEVNNNPSWHGTPPGGNWTQTMEVDRLEVYWWQ